VHDEGGLGDLCVGKIARGSTPRARLLIEFTAGILFISLCTFVLRNCASHETETAVATGGKPMMSGGGGSGAPDTLVLSALQRLAKLLALRMKDS